MNTLPLKNSSGEHFTTEK